MFGRKRKPLCSRFAATPQQTTTAPKIAKGRKKRKTVSLNCVVNASASVERTKGREKVAVQKSSKKVERELAVAARKRTAPVSAAAATAS